MCRNIRCDIFFYVYGIYVVATKQDLINVAQEERKPVSADLPDRHVRVTPPWGRLVLVFNRRGRKEPSGPGVARRAWRRHCSSQVRAPSLLYGCLALGLGFLAGVLIRPCGGPQPPPCSDAVGRRRAVSRPGRAEIWGERELRKGSVVD